MGFLRRLFGAKPRAAPEEVEPGQPIPPSPERVARRALVLAALAYRGALESDPDDEELRRQLVRWVDVLNLGDELEPHERDLLRTLIGRADERDINAALWRLEGLAVLAWSLRCSDLPAYDERMDCTEVPPSVGFSESLLCAHDTSIARNLLQHAALRPASEISRFASHITIVSWRLRQLRLNREALALVDMHPELKQSIPFTPALRPMDFAAYLRRYPMFKEQWLEGLRFVGGDLAIGANSVTEAPLEQVNDCTSIAEERQIAAYWLQGDKRVYSEVSPDTFLSAC